MGLFDKFKKKETVEEDPGIYSPVAGKVATLESLHDGMFSEKILGDGIVVIPSDGEFKVPVSGVLESAFPTGHAYGIRTKSGREVLIHIGLDTVEMKGEGFRSYVKQGQEVRMGDKMVSVDLQAVEKAGYSSATIIIVTSQDKISYRVPEDTTVKACEKLLELD